jgi:hypothetical protein
MENNFRIKAVVIGSETMFTLQEKFFFFFWRDISIPRYKKDKNGVFEKWAETAKVFTDPAEFRIASKTYTTEWREAKAKKKKEVAYSQPFTYATEVLGFDDEDEEQKELEKEAAAHDKKLF